MTQKLYVIVNKDGNITRGSSKNTLGTFVSRKQAEKQFNRYIFGESGCKIVEYGEINNDSERTN